MVVIWKGLCLLWFLQSRCVLGINVAWISFTRPVCIPTSWKQGSAIDLLKYPAVSGCSTLSSFRFQSHSTSFQRTFQTTAIQCRSEPIATNHKMMRAQTTANFPKVHSKPIQDKEDSNMDRLLEKLCRAESGSGQVKGVLQAIVSLDGIKSRY